MAPSICVSFLLVLCIIQFVIISKLIGNHSNQHHIAISGSGSSDAGIVSAKLPFAEKLPLPQSDALATAIISSSHNSLDKVDGVAVTVMLHSPKWFQRRYAILIQNTINNIPDAWKVQIFYTGKGQSQAGLDINPGINRFIKSGKVILTLLPKELEKVKKYQLMFSPWFWSHMIADKVLIFGGNSILCSNSLYSIRDFLQYDYVGAPWDTKKGMGGDGGISIRSRNHMLLALNYALDKIESPEKRAKPYDYLGQEDRFFVSTLLEMNQKHVLSSNIAPKEVTYQFAAIGAYSNESVLAASGTLPDVEYEVREKFLQYCPELKMVYPSLHDPNCFGASPNGDECAKSICALRPRELRKGGC